MVKEIPVSTDSIVQKQFTFILKYAKLYAVKCYKYDDFYIVFQWFFYYAFFGVGDAGAC